MTHFAMTALDSLSDAFQLHCSWYSSISSSLIACILNHDVQILRNTDMLVSDICSGLADCQSIPIQFLQQLLRILQIRYDRHQHLRKLSGIVFSQFSNIYARICRYEISQNRFILACDNHLTVSDRQVSYGSQVLVCPFRPGRRSTSRYPVFPTSPSP